MSKQDTTVKPVRIFGGVQSPISLSISELMGSTVGLERTLDELAELSKEQKNEIVQSLLKRILRILKIHDSELQFFQQSLDNLPDETRPVAILKNEQLKDDEPLYLTGNTSLYGFLIEISGTKQLKAVLQLEDYSEVKCFLPNQEMARELGSRIYKFIGLRGEAKWSFEDNTLYEFRVEELLPYEESGDYATIFKELRSEFGMHYNGIDPTQFLIDS
jgi:hypothetical protein